MNLVPVTDPELLKQLNAPAAPTLRPVTDPALLQQLNTPAQPATKKQIYTIQTPTGRKLEIEAGDQETALRGAREWEAQNPLPDPQAQKGDLGVPLPAPQHSLARDSGLAARAIGRGVADTLGAPGDAREGTDYFGTAAVNAVGSGVNKYISPAIEGLLNWAGAGDHNIPDLPQMDRGHISDVLRIMPGLGGPTSDQIAGASEAVGKDVGVNLPTPETHGERLASTGLRFATGALLPGGIMAKGAKVAMEGGKIASELPAILRPYAENATRTLAGDAAGGVGAGVANDALDEYAPDWLKDNVWARFLATVGGGTAGNGLASVARLPKRVAEAAVGHMADSTPALRDPMTGDAPQHRNLDQAAKFLQESSTSPKDAANSIAKNQQYFDEVGGAMPTSGLMSDDVGLQMLEKALRQNSGKPFLERDKALRNSAIEDLNQARPPGADPMAARIEAQQQVKSRQAAASQGVRFAQSNVDDAHNSERELMQQYQPFGGGDSVASQDLDKVIVDSVLKPRQGRKNALFDAVDPEGNVIRSIQPLSDLAKAMQKSAEGLPETVRRQIVPDGLLNDIAAKAENGGTMSFKDLNEMRSAVASMEHQARGTSQFPMATSLQKIKNAISEDARSLASEGNDAGQRALNASKYYEQEFAPLFAQGEGGEFRKDFNRDDPFRTKTPPTATAQRFLREGPGGFEAAASLQKILAASPDAAQGADAARRFVLSDMARVVGADGKVSETALRRWINARSGMLSQIPAIDKEVKGLLGEVTDRAAISGRLRNDLETAVASKVRTQRELDNSALSLLIDSDPKRAAQSVLNSKDPIGAAVELRKAFEGNASAERGWRAAVTDHLVESLGASGKAGISDDLDAVSLAKMDTLFRKNEPALRTIFGDDTRFLMQARRRLELLSNKSVQAAGASEPPKVGIVQKLIRPLDVVLRLWFGALEGGSRSKKYRVLAEQLPDTRRAAADLIKRSMFDPEVAKHLLTRPLKETELPTWNKKLNRLMGWAAAGRAVNSQDNNLP